MIRLSLLPTAHPRTFQRSRVRTSVPFYGHFKLSVCRSLGFGSTACDIVALFRLAFATAPRLSRLARPHTATRRFIMQKARRRSFPLRGIELRQLVDAWFQVLLTPLIRVLFIVQSPYLSTIGRDVVFSLGEWSPRFHTKFHELRATLVRQT